MPLCVSLLLNFKKYDPKRRMCPSPTDMFNNGAHGFKKVKAHPPSTSVTLTLLQDLTIGHRATIWIFTAIGLLWIFAIYWNTVELERHNEVLPGEDILTYGNVSAPLQNVRRHSRLNTFVAHLLHLGRHSCARALQHHLARSRAHQQEQQEIHYGALSRQILRHPRRRRRRQVRSPRRAWRAQ